MPLTHRCRSCDHEADVLGPAIEHARSSGHADYETSYVPHGVERFIAACMRCAAQIESVGTAADPICQTCRASSDRATEEGEPCRSTSH